MDQNNVTKPDNGLNGLLSIVDRLREPDGCPWDRKQTAQTFKSYVIEEAHELVEAIQADEPEHIREELGDLLFQLVFLTRIYEEKNLFSMREVIQSISEKMIRRHPHVFGDIEAGSEEEMRRRWQEIKSREKAKRGNPSLSSLPRTLPALRRAQRISERATRAANQPLTKEDSLHRLISEAEQIHEAFANGKGLLAIGDLLFTLADFCRMAAIDAEDALQAAVDRRIKEIGDSSA
jgi:MazG family protein